MDPSSRNPAGHGRAAAACVLALAALAPSALSAQRAAAASPAALTPPSAAIGAECERAVRQALVPGSTKAPEVRFSAAPSVLQALSGEGQTVLGGEGRWRDAAGLRSFTYRCNIDTNSAEAVGVVIRQAVTQPQVLAEPRAVQEPDLSHLSPSACESSAAAALKKRWPQVSRISFDTATRSLMQQSASRAELRGQGRAQPAPEPQALVHFSFDCALDPRDGRVVDMRVSG
ncbi:MAG: hypothetical protein ABIR94_09065 [Rubrivivax sp.]